MKYSQVLSCVKAVFSLSWRTFIVLRSVAHKKTVTKTIKHFEPKLKQAYRSIIKTLI